MVIFNHAEIALSIIWPIRAFVLDNVEKIEVVG
jgi:hypothetical protein